MAKTIALLSSNLLTAIRDTNIPMLLKIVTMDVKARVEHINRGANMMGISLFYRIVLLSSFSDRI